MYIPLSPISAMRLYSGIHETRRLFYITTSELQNQVLYSDIRNNKKRKC